MHGFSPILPGLPLRLGKSTGRGGAAPLAPILYIVGSSTAFSPEFNVVGQFLPGDIVEVEYKTSGGSWTSPVSTTHVVTTGELGGTLFLYVISPNLAPGAYDFRMRFKRPGGAYSNYSNEVQVTIPPPSPIVVYRGDNSWANGASVSAQFDIGQAAADRLVIVGFECAGTENGSTNIVNTCVMNDVSLTKQVQYNTDRHLSFWSGIVAAGSGLQTLQMTFTGLAFQPRLAFVWTSTGQNSNAFKANAAQTSSTNLAIAVDAGDVLLALSYPNALRNFNPLSSETANQHDNTQGSSFTNFGVLGSAADWVVNNTNAAFSVRVENPSSPGFSASAVRLAVTLR